ncbi:hypothetical protein HPB49_005343 [Dermacentor silvarum]|uniref:Uncharacterized protein n=1 Tax=Dermacentor silvarum TaxID=543639 RepID=A0ACB8DN00_DERSI|nr:hypothetical protein HPB49_005343 [Dermacentor silvarum]
MGRLNPRPNQRHRQRKKKTSRKRTIFLKLLWSAFRPPAKTKQRSGPPKRRLLVRPSSDRWGRNKTSMMITKRLPKPYWTKCVNYPFVRREQYVMKMTKPLCEKECAYNASLLMCRCIRVDVALPYEVDWDRQPSGKRRFCDADIARQLSLVFASIHSVLAVGTFSRDNIYATLLYINFSAQTFFS